MAEIDVFERSLAGAFLRLADDVPGTVDATAVAHRVAIEHPRRHGGAGRLRFLAVPRLAWVLLLLGALLAVMVGGMLVVGSQLQPKLPAVVPNLGPVATCPPGSTPDKPGPVDQARPLEDQSAMAFAFDRRAGRLVALMSAGAGVETWTFDVCTNTWARMHPNQEPPGFEWARLVYDADSEVTLLVSSGRVWAYDLQADTWTVKGVVTDAWLWAYDPLSGLVVAQGGPDPSVSLSTYDVETDTWTPIHQAGAPQTGGISAAGWPYYGELAYDASVDRIVAVGDGRSGGGAWLFDIRTGRWSRSGAETPVFMEVFAAPPDIAYDEAAKRTVVIGDTRSAAYDAAADRWEILAERELSEDAVGPMAFDGLMAGPMVFDPVNERLVGPADMAAVVAFDPATRELTVLLEPSTR